VKVRRGIHESTAPAGNETFSGEVSIGTIFEADGPGRMNGAFVRFEPGARTHWHSHPDGQALIVVEGRGRTQVEGGAVTAIASGDAVYIPAGERHWHGADPDAAMAHVSITGEGGTVWDGPPVTGADYDGEA
jgi:quercetin dioxygenase-like cupin family protein